MADAGTLTRADIAEAINRHVGLSRADASAIIESILEHVKTGVEVPITPRRVLTFRASQGLRHKVK